MQFLLSLFLMALGLACLLEALPWLLAPEKMREALRSLLENKPELLRLWGLFLLIVGLVLIWLGRS